MSESQQLARFTTSMENMRRLVEWSSAPFDEAYNQLWMNVADGEIRTVANAGKSVVSYCDFSEPFVEDLELHKKVDAEAGAQAIVKAPRVNDYLNFVGGTEITVELFGSPEDSPRAEQMKITGDLSAIIYVISSDSDYAQKQLRVVDKYDDDNNWITSSGDPLEVSFTTNAEEFERIVDVVEFDDFSLANYPVVVKDGEFLLSAKDKNRGNQIRGTLYAEEVEGPDVEKYFSRGIEELFGKGKVTGKINVSVGAGKDGPLVIVRESNDGALTLRYSVLPVA